MKWINPSEIAGTIKAPPSKSMMIRAVAMGLLCNGESRILNPSFCDDALAAISIIETLGAKVKIINQELKLEGGIEISEKTSLDCGESGLCMRMFAPIAALVKGTVILDGKGSLISRPMEMLEDPLNKLGCICRTNNGRAPVVIAGPLNGGRVLVSGSISSQFLSGLLMALPLCEKESEVIVNDLKSKPYIAMTLSLLSNFGILIDHNIDLSRFYINGMQHYLNRVYSVEGDWSCSSFFLVAGAIGGYIGIQDLSLSTQQADKKILEVLEIAGAKIQTQNNCITVEQGPLFAFQFDATHYPDLFPPLVVLACFCKGQSEIHGVERLVFKESNRADSLLNEFRKIGAEMEIKEGKMLIKGNSLKGGTINSHGDHRIAMAAAVAGTKSQKGVAIKNWRCVSKSYPDFFDKLNIITRRLG